MPGDGRRALGVRGEDAVAEWYRRNGYTVVARNWRCREGELDLIVRRGQLYVFCEVKSRSSSRFGMPVEAVTRTKQLRLRRLATGWLAEHSPRAKAIRFDVAAVMGDAVEVIEAAF